MRHISAVIEPKYVVEAVAVSQHGNTEFRFDISGNSAVDIIDKFNKIKDDELRRGYELFLPSSVYELEVDEIESSLK